MDLTPYDEEMQELRDWLADGPRSADDFDRTFSTDKLIGRPGRICPMTPDTPVLGSYEQGIGPNTWAGRLNLLQIMQRTGEIEGYKNDGMIFYRLTPTGNGEG